jgi:cytochrome c5
MKKIYFLLMTTTVVIILTASVLSDINPSDKKIAKAITTAPIPDAVQQIIKKSCMDCHATGGSSGAMLVLNFSEWENYKPGKQVKKAEAICNIVSKGDMPPKSYRNAHPDAIPTEAQQDTICMWSATLTQHIE